jgi:hypothetical protein
MEATLAEEAALADQCAGQREPARAALIGAMRSHNASGTSQIAGRSLG